MVPNFGMFVLNLRTHSWFKLSKIETVSKLFTMLGDLMLVKYVGENCMLVKTRYVGE